MLLPPLALGFRLLAFFGFWGMLVLSGERDSYGGELGSEIVELGVDTSLGNEFEWSVGYDSHYIFRGEFLQYSTFWTELSYEWEINDTFSLGVTPWFLQDAIADYDEWNLLVDLTATFGETEFTLGYAGFWYPRGDIGAGVGEGAEHEFSVGASRSLGPLTVGVLSAWNYNRDGFYYELSVEYEHELSDSLTLTPMVTSGWDHKYYDNGGGWNHMAFLVKVDWAVSSRLSVSPYVAENITSARLENRNDFFGGIQIAMEF